MKKLLPFLLFFFAYLPFTFSQDRTITVEVLNLKNDHGTVRLVLFDNPEYYPEESEKALKKASATISSNKSKVMITGLKSGTYAISLFHDENNNGELDTNWLGIPKEGVGASNDAKGRMGPPHFEDAKFQLNGEDLTLKIRITYL